MKANTTNPIAVIPTITKLTKGRPKDGDDLALKLPVYLVPGKLALDVAADIGI